MSRPAPSPPDDSRAALVTGTIVASYRIEREIGRGAAGVVFAACHALTGALVALKVVPREGKTHTAERFEREVQALAKLQHPNVVGIHEAGEAGPFRWYSMDLVEGEPLDRRLGRAGEPLAAIKLLLQVARGMEHAHARGLVHRDLKPSNVLVTADGRARVSDFGIAKHVDRATLLTQPGAVLGTIHYMAPEQCADSTRIDGRADVWSVGVMLFEAATGKLPFEGETALTVATRICSEPLPRPRALAPRASPDLEAVIVRALEKDPADRYQDMSALAADLERLLRDEPVSASRVTLRRQLLRRFGAGGLALGALLAALVSGLGVFLVLHGLRVRAELSESQLRADIRARADDAEASSARALEKGRAAFLTSPGEARAIASRALAERLASEEHLGGTDASAPGSDEALAARARLDASPVRSALLVLEARAVLLEGDAPRARELLEPGARDDDPELLLALGEARLACGDAKGAEEALARAARLAPDRWEPVLRLAEAHVQAGADEGVEELLAAAGAKHAPDAALEAARAERLVALGRGREALEPLAGAIRAAPAASALRVARARALLATDDEAGALADLRAAGQHDGLAVREEVRVHLASGAVADAALALERLVKLAPDDADTIVDLAAMRGALGELEAGASLVEGAAARAAGGGEATKRDVVPLLVALVPLAVALDRDPRPFLARLEAVAPLEAARARARLAAQPVALLAFREGRADACVALDSMRAIRHRLAEEQRRPGLGHFSAADAAPSPDLLERAARSLRFAVAIDPALVPARALLVRVELALGRSDAARSHAIVAQAQDPLGVEAGALLATVARGDETSSVVERTARALEAEPGPASVPLRDALARLLERAGDAKRAATLEREAGSLGKGDRELLAHALELLERAQDPDAPAVRAQLEAADRAADEARALAHEADAVSIRSHDRCIELAARAMAAEPHDLEIHDICAYALRRLWRTFGEHTSIAAYDPPSDPIVNTARLALLDGRVTAEPLRHVHSMRSVFGNELVADWRRMLSQSAGDERTAIGLALALVGGTWDLYTQDTATAFLSMKPHMPLNDLHAALADLAERAPECSSFYGARAVHFARAGQAASMQRDIDRFCGHHPATVSDIWLASALSLTVGDTEAAVKLALQGIHLPGASEGDRRMFVDDLPFFAIRDSAAWARVAAAVGH